MAGDFVVLAAGVTLFAGVAFVAVKASTSRRDRGRSNHAIFQDEPRLSFYEDEVSGPDGGGDYAPPRAADI